MQGFGPEIGLEIRGMVVVDKAVGRITLQHCNSCFSCIFCFDKRIGADDDGLNTHFSDVDSGYLIRRQYREPSCFSGLFVIISTTATATCVCVVYVFEPYDEKWTEKCLSALCLPFLS